MIHHRAAGGKSFHDLPRRDLRLVRGGIGQRELGCRCRLRDEIEEIGGCIESDLVEGDRAAGGRTDNRTQYDRRWVLLAHGQNGSRDLVL